MRHLRTQGDDLIGAGGVVLQGRHPAHYKLECIDETIMADIVAKDMFSAN